VEDQASDRAYRIGQTRDVQVLTFVAAGTLVEKIADMLEAKRAPAASIVRAGRQAPTDPASRQLRSGLELGVEVGPVGVSWARGRVLSDAQWARAEAAMASRAVFLARLLAGEMPDEIEEAFEAAGIGLFPARRGDLTTACTCPDTANPCKHSAAVYYLLAESFD